jgi:hypothetical protein
MGHKYSTVYQHNTYASYEIHRHAAIEDINTLVNTLGSKCKFINSYKFYTRCKLCNDSLYHQQVIILNCSTKHKYHTTCLQSFIRFVNYDEGLKCQGCRDILNLYEIETL